MTRAEKLGSRGRPAPDGNVKANGNTDGLHNPRVCVKEESVPKESTRQRSRHLGGSAGGVSGSWLGPALGSTLSPSPPGILYLPLPRQARGRSP